MQLLETQQTVKFINVYDKASIHHTLYIDYNMQRGRYKVLALDPSSSYKYQGDFFGLLHSLRVDPKHFIDILRVNNMNSPYDFQGTEVTIKIPDTPRTPKLTSSSP